MIRAKLRLLTLIVAIALCFEATAFAGTYPFLDVLGGAPQPTEAPQYTSPEGSSADAETSPRSSSYPFLNVLWDKAQPGDAPDDLSAALPEAGAAQPAQGSKYPFLNVLRGGSQPGGAPADPTAATPGEKSAYALALTLKGIGNTITDVSAMPEPTTALMPEYATAAPSDAPAVGQPFSAMVQALANSGDKVLNPKPLPEPTEQPVLETVRPTDQPTAEPTEAPTPEPTEAPTPEPTEQPTAEPTVSPDVLPVPTAAVALLPDPASYFGVEGHIDQTGAVLGGVEYETWFYTQPADWRDSLTAWLRACESAGYSWSVTQISGYSAYVVKNDKGDALLLPDYMGYVMLLKQPQIAIAPQAEAYVPQLGELSFTINNRRYTATGLSLKPQTVSYTVQDTSPLHISSSKVAQARILRCELAERVDDLYSLELVLPAELKTGDTITLDSRTEGFYTLRINGLRYINTADPTDQLNSPGDRCTLNIYYSGAERLTGRLDCAYSTGVVLTLDFDLPINSAE